MFFAPSKSRKRNKIRIMDVSKTTDLIEIKIKMPNPSQEPPASSEAPNEDFKGHGCSLHPQNQEREPKFGSWVYQRAVTISKSRSRIQTPVRNLQRPPKPQKRTQMTWMFFIPSKSR